MAISLTGEYHNNVDAKGRVMVPKKLREMIPGNTLVITRAIDHCLWVFLPEQWESFSATLIGKSSMLDTDTRIVRRNIIAPAQYCDIDKTGRINIPASLRDAASILTSGEVAWLGMGELLELWDINKLNESFADPETLVAAASAVSTKLGGGTL